MIYKYGTKFDIPAADAIVEPVAPAPLAKTFLGETSVYNHDKRTVTSNFAAHDPASQVAPVQISLVVVSGITLPEDPKTLFDDGYQNTTVPFPAGNTDATEIELVVPPALKTGGVAVIVLGYPD